MGLPAMEYRATLVDGTIKGFDQASADALMDQHNIVQLPGETAYAYRLRALRHLSGQNIVKWCLADNDAPVYHARGMSEPVVMVSHSNTGIQLTMLFLAVAAVVLLVMSIFST